MMTFPMGKDLTPSWGDYFPGGALELVRGEA